MDKKPDALRKPDPEAEARAKTRFAIMHAEREARAAMLPAIRAEGEAALRRLLPIAQRDTGQSSVVACCLLNLYNGDRFPFDMTDFRRLDSAVFDDCIAVLKMDVQPAKEVHNYFENGGKIWEKLAADWAIKDHCGINWRRAE
jgi:hypothetical protein